MYNSRELNSTFAGMSYYCFVVMLQMADIDRVKQALSICYNIIEVAYVYNESASKPSMLIFISSIYLHISFTEDTSTFYVPAVKPLLIAVWSQAENAKLPFEETLNVIVYDDKGDNMPPSLKMKIIHKFSFEGQTIIDATDASMLIINT